jgi:hypothetical protein
MLTIQVSPALEALFACEWRNHWAMAGEAAGRRDSAMMPPPPTLGSAYGSVEQAPVDVLQEWMGGVSGETVAAAVVELGELVVRLGEAEPLPEEE